MPAWVNGIVPLRTDHIMFHLGTPPLQDVCSSVFLSSIDLSK
jgi:hypothetical protein